MALAYLLSPTFQVENSAGKPATGGWIETFVSGSRDPYYCYSDFQGTLHPFKIPLDSLGSNVVLADDGQAYDVYVYNRYGSLLMSRYNVKPGHGAGGGGGTITSSDGSIDVTMTPTGYDLKVNGQEASVLRAGANDLTSDGQFVFYELVRDGDHVTVDSNGKIRLEDGWYHYDVTARVKWEDGVAVANTENHIQLYTTLNSDIIPFDCSYEHDDTLHLHGQVKITTSGSQFVVGVQGIETGMSIELVDCGLFAITGHGDAAEYEAGTGIIIDDHEISVDPSVVQEKLTAGTGIIIDDNEVSVDTTAIQKKLEAGDNIVIEGNVISATAAPQEQSDWTETDTTDVSYIKHKPSTKTVVAGENITITEETNSFVISANTGSQVQADWSETDTEDPSYIQNKPDLSVYATTQAMDTALAGKQDVISDLAAIRSGAALGATATQPADLAAGLATKQDVISDLATIRSGAALGATSIQPSDLATVATTGSYDDLIDKPVIPAAQVQADWSESDSTSVSYIQHKPDLSVYATDSDLTAGLATKQDTISDLSDIRSGAALGETAVQPSDLATVATTGSYEDLTDKPVIPAAQVQSDWSETDTSDPSYIQNKPDLSVYATDSELTAGLATKQDTISDLANIRSGAAAGATAVQPGDLATVATTGSYADLSNTPSIPTATSDLTNDSGFITLSDVPAQVNADWNSSSGASEILNKPTIPSGAQLVPAATSADADKVLTVDSQGTPAWASAQAPISAGTGIDITNNVVSVDTSVVATQTDLASKQDTLTAGTNVSITNNVISATDTTYSAGEGIDITNNEISVEAPVDIVAGPGIVIDNPDGNTLRVSVAQAEEVELFSGTAANTNVVLNETLDNFERIKIYAYWKGTNTYDYYGYSVTEIYTSQLSVGKRFTVNVFCNLNDSEFYSIANFSVASTKTQLDLVNVKRASLTEQLIAQNDGPTVYKVVGIHRLANN